MPGVVVPIRVEMDIKVGPENVVTRHLCMVETFVKVSHRRIQTVQRIHAWVNKLENRIGNNMGIPVSRKI
jgi:hypothetical protein